MEALRRGRRVAASLSTDSQPSRGAGRYSPKLSVNEIFARDREALLKQGRAHGGWNMCFDFRRRSYRSRLGRISHPDLVRPCCGSRCKASDLLRTVCPSAQGRCGIEIKNPAALATGQGAVWDARSNHGRGPSPNFLARKGWRERVRRCCYSGLIANALEKLASRCYRRLDTS